MRCTTPRLRSTLAGTHRAPSCGRPHAHYLRRRGFTLLETALATVIIGVGVLALVEAHTVFSRSNDFSTQSATANYLANELRERIRRLPRHDPATSIFFTTSNGNQVLGGWGPSTNETSVVDYNDVDDFDGAAFGTGGTMAGPISATGAVVPELNLDGTPVLDNNGLIVPLRGWSQWVTVEKVEPQNFSTVRARNYFRAPNPPSDPGLAVDRFPLRVTVVVRYRGPGETTSREMTRLVWIQP